jgi:hypothetical protein
MPITASSGALTFFKYGTQSLPGSGKWISTVFPSSAPEISSAGDGLSTLTNFANPGGYTIEYWANYSKVTNPNGHLLQVGNFTKGFGFNWIIYVDSSRRVTFQGNFTGGLIRTPTNTIALNTWFNVALSCSNSGGVTTIRLFVNGTLYGSITTTFDPTTIFRPWVISTGNNTFLEQAALIDELRISNITRYTSNYSVATSEFTPDANTMLLLHFSLTGTSNPASPEIINSSTINSWTVGNSLIVPVTIDTNNYKF